MKKTVFSMIMALAAGCASAEDIIQVVPFQTQAGIVSDDESSFVITMNNTSLDVWALQFDILLPEGMEFDTTEGLDPIEMIDGRYPTSGRQKTKNHQLTYNVVSTGWMRIIINTTKSGSLSGDSGDILRVYYTTSDDFADGIHPIYVDGTVLTPEEGSQVKASASSSYCYVGDKPFDADGNADLTCMTGYLPSFVVDGLGELLQQSSEVQEVDLSGATALGGSLDMGQSNALVMVQSEEVAASVEGNAVVDDGTGAPTCQNLMLHDGGGAFGTSRSFTATVAGMDRQFKGGQWQTVCLPFGLTEAQVSAVREAGCEVQRLQDYDATTSELNFADATAMEPNTPYIIRCEADAQPFIGIADAEVASSATMGDITTGAVTMQGSFRPATISSDEAVTYYAYDAADGAFVRIGERAQVLPFRAVIAVPSASASAKRLAVRHSGEAIATGIEENVQWASVNAQTIFDLMGRHLASPATGKPCIVNGRKVMY